jgi:N-acetylglucosamine-6-phosphate deacetylase
VVMSVGHTEADADTTAAAFAAGARHVTHLGNAMPGIDRRAPGPMAAALADSRVTLEVIADGIHVHPRFLSLLGAVAPDRLVAVTDATAACGMPPGSYRLGVAEVVVDAERVVLADRPGTLAGSVLTMDRAVATLVAAGVDLATAVTAATATPAGVVSAAGKGHLRPGADADLVVLGDDLVARATVAGGVVASDPDRLLAAVGAGHGRGAA